MRYAYPEPEVLIQTHLNLHFKIRAGDNTTYERIAANNLATSSSNTSGNHQVIWSKRLHRIGWTVQPWTCSRNDLWAMDINHHRWTDCEIFQSESSPDPINLNPIQTWSANVKSGIFILPHEAKYLLELFCLSPIAIGWRQNTSSSVFASWGKIDTAFRHFQNLTRKCLLGIRGKSTAGVILPLGESNCLDWSSDKIHLDQRKVLVTWPNSLNLKPKLKPKT